MVPRTCGSQACPDLALMRSLTLVLAFLLGSAINATYHSSEKGIHAGLGFASLTNTSGHDPSATSPSITTRPSL